nr:MAG TPA: hypothetical protein [Herelleviridae sp.]
MRYYWKDGFYIDEIHFSKNPETNEYVVPDGYVEITKELYFSLLQGQAVGKRIITGSTGLPELADPPPPVISPVDAAKQLFRSLQIKAAAMSIPTEDDVTAEQLAPICPTWTAGEHYKALEIVNHDGFPYRVIQDVDALEHQAPGTEGMLAIYRPIDASAGTKEDPKTFFYGMDVENGLYYRYQDVLYIAKADMPACVYYPGSEGVWQWEQVIETSEKLSNVVL